ncbi:MAG TPA: DUF5050 domain-containing protein [candidate division Zixibacteria bacterium]
MKTLLKCLFVVLIASVVGFLFGGCSKKTTSPTTPGEITVTGKVDLPSGASIEPESLVVLSPVNSDAIGSDSSFSANLPPNTAIGVMCITDKNDDPLLLGYIFTSGFNPTFPKVKSAYKTNIISNSGEAVTINSQTTALSLIMLSPLLIGSSPEQRNEFAQRAVDHQDFPSLVSDIDNMIVNNPENYLTDSTKSPQIFQKAASISLDVLRSFEQESLMKAQKTLRANPSIEDAAGTKVNFINPYYIFYGTGIYDYSTSDEIDVFVQSPRKLFWGTIPYLGPDGKTEYDLGNGDFNIQIYKGFHWFPLNLSDPKCIATWYNTGQGLLNILDLIVCIPGVTNSISTIGIIVQNASDFKGAVELGAALREGDTFEAILGFLRFISSNTYQILVSVLQSSSTPENISKYLNVTKNVAGNVTIALRALNAATKIPFFLDIAYLAPPELEYDVSQVDGNLGFINRPLGKIAFYSTRDGGYDKIYVMNADGTQQTRLTDNTSSNQHPSWSPDGDKIAFVSHRDGYSEIYVMNADGTQQTRLTNSPSGDYWGNFHPSWSPDGQKIAFMSDRDGNWKIYVMNADGSGQMNLTNNTVWEMYPCWSPNGEKIAFTRAGQMLGIYVMNADGTQQTRLTDNPYFFNDQYPSWSPDGQKIAFTSTRDGYSEIYIMNADGSEQTNLTNNDSGDGSPCWGPDGEKIAFESYRDGNWEIYVMNADGSEQTRLTFNSITGHYDGCPSWTR